VSATGVQGTTTLTGNGAAAAGATEAADDTTVGAVATSSATTTRLTVGATVIDLGAVSTRTTINCSYGASGFRYSFNGTSSVASAKINGRPVKMSNGPMSIKVAGGTLLLNQTRTTPAGVVQQAAKLHTKKADVIIGGAAVAVAETPDNPCHP
jgi:hypothetical protein